MNNKLSIKNETIVTLENLFINAPRLEKMSSAPLEIFWDAEAREETNNERLLELIDFSQMNSLFENFLAVTGLPVAIIDLNGTVRASSKWQRLCMEFHRVNTKTLQRCLESDRSIYEQLEVGQSFSSHQCKNGLIDCASPIVIDGHHIANLFIGQFFIQEPNPEFFGQQQQRFGFDKKAYFDAIAEVPVIYEEKLPIIMSLLVGWAEQLALHTLSEKRALVALESVEQTVKERTEQLRQNNEELQQFFNQPFIGMLTVRCDKKPISVNQRFCEMVGYSREELLNLTCDDITHPDDVPLNIYHAQALRGEIDTYRMEKRYIHKDGHIVYVDLAANCVRDAAGNLEYLVGMIQDITERKATEKYIHQLAFYDPLTQLPNRRLLHDRIKHSMEITRRAGNQMAVMMLDLDKFKIVNDSLGHAAGDELLRQVANRLKNCLRESDTVARLGGDEFVVVLENIHALHDVVHVASDIIEVLNCPFTLLQNHEVQIGVSIGITLYPKHGHDGDILIDKADVALYQAKHTGRGRFAYFSENFIAS
ncbi:MAG: diguanylate cyclase [Methylococcales bacterium]|nr:diguanylate cyclase [Methylococcales bacterium]